MSYYAWLLPLLPVLAFAICGIFLHNYERLTKAIVVGVFGILFLISGGIALEVFGGAATMDAPIEYGITWLELGGMTVEAGILIDPLSAMMLFVVCGIGLLVAIYSLGYMHGDPGTPHFFTYLSMFVASMLILVLANNYFMVFVGWELVGLCSYLLIGYYYQTNSAAKASQKAFLFNRVADFGFMVGFFLVFATFGTFNFTELNALIPAHADTVAVTVMAILVLIGPMGKSAQFPFHVWLPDAMEGPTPVSALIHAATMVAAGVYLLARQFALFSSSATAMTVIMCVGGFTAIFAASMALVATDIKRVLAFSTLSQLGYMFLAVGLGSITAATFHLGTHAFFKALLFLGAGSVIHAVGSNEMDKMGGLAKKMPITTVTFIIGSLALAGIFPFAGFWSKDEIIATAFNSGHYFWFVIAEIVAFMTAFYMFRLIFRTFFGENHSDQTPHESPLTMTVPLMILAVFAALVGFVGAPFVEHGYASFIYYGEVHHPSPNYFVIVVSTLAAVSGIVLAWLMYSRKTINPKQIARSCASINTLLNRKYYIDEIYQFIFDYVVLSFSKACKWFDNVVIDGFLDWLTDITKWAGSKLRRTETGDLQTYALVMFLAVIVMVLWRAVPMLGGI